MLLRMSIIAIVCVLSQLSFATQNNELTSPYLLTPKQHKKLTPEQALAKLKQGNIRFVVAKKHDRDLLKLARISSKKGQFPFALVLSCIDSRSIPDLVFDQGLGNVFVARDAGNIVSPTIYASMEFAVKIMGADLIVIMGHTQCGAVQAACVGKGSGHLVGLIQKIRPAVLAVEKKTGNKNCADPQLINQIARQNVIDQINSVLNNVPAFTKLINEKKLMIVGAMHDLQTGKVVFFNRFGKDIP